MKTENLLPQEFGLNEKQAKSIESADSFTKLALKMKRVTND